MMAALQRRKSATQSVGRMREGGPQNHPGMYLNASAPRAAGETLLAIEDRASKDRSSIRWTWRRSKRVDGPPAPRGHARENNDVP